MTFYYGIRKYFALGFSMRHANYQNLKLENIEQQTETLIIKLYIYNWDKG